MTLPSAKTLSRKFLYRCWLRTICGITKLHFALVADSRKIGYFSIEIRAVGELTSPTIAVVAINTSLAVWRADPLGCLNMYTGKGNSMATLLIVEDNPTQQLIYTQLCKRFGYEAYITRTGEEALAALPLSKYAAVVLDIGLPGISGLDVARELRWAEMGTTERTPVIGISSTEPAHQARQQCIEAGMDDYVSKPVSVDAFRRMLLRWTYDSRTPNLMLLNRMVDPQPAEKL